MTIPDTEPTTVTSFATKADAEGWIAAHKKRVGRSPSLSSRHWPKRPNTSQAASLQGSSSATRDRNSQNQFSAPKSH